MRISFVKIALAVSLIFNLSFLVAAGVFYHQKSAYWVSPFGAKVPRDRFMFEELSLKPDQIKVLRENATLFHGQVDRKRQEIAAKRQDLLRLLRADAPDTASIHAVLRQISGTQEELERMVTAHILQQKAVLDRQQQDKFLDLIQNTVTQKGSGTGPARCN
jgi:Spy/CpxP family protein refolding chaperone